ncbi:MAG TPA: DinB family protein [Anaerolineae bacterium]|nr:DinB family protein [Anaerolineae bacterium]
MSSLNTPATEPEATPRSRAELLERIRQSHAAFEQMIRALSEAQLTTPGADDGWSVKDHLAHLAAWQRGITALLRRQPRYAAMGLERPGPDASFDDLNAVLYQHSKDRPLSEVLADFRAAHQEMLSVLGSLSDADLLKPYSHYQPGEREDNRDPIVNWIEGDSYGHYEEHLPWIQALIK